MQKIKISISLCCLFSKFGELLGQDSMEHGSEVAKTGQTQRVLWPEGQHSPDFKQQYSSRDINISSANVTDL